MGLIKIRSDIKKLELTLAELQRYQEEKKTTRKKPENKEDKSNGSGK